MANQNYQQTEMDLRTNLQQDVDCRVASVIDDTYDMLKDYNPPAVRNRHEAYGIAADNFTRISAKVKSVRNDMDTLLSTLANPNYPAVEAVSSLHNRVSELISLSIVMAAEMKRTMNDLYEAERKDDTPTPLEQAAAENNGNDLRVGRRDPRPGASGELQHRNRKRSLSDGHGCAQEADPGKGEFVGKLTIRKLPALPRSRL